MMNSQKSLNINNQDMKKNLFGKILNVQIEEYIPKKLIH